VAPPVTASTDSSEARSDPPRAPEIAWLQPYPDSLLEPVAPAESEPEAVATSRETIELVFLAALQHLPPRQRAILILCDVLDWSASETAALLGTTVPSVNSALQRARLTMRSRQPAARANDITAPLPPSEQERATLRTFMQAWEQADVDRMTSLLREDARWAMPPAPLWFDGRAAIVRLYELFPIDWQGRSFRMVPTAANRQPAAAAYLQSANQTLFRLVALHVLRIEGGQIAEVTTFGPDLCRAFQLPETL
jgi:RNA polymerase sigma-70 factor (ECF subfamily)